MFLSLTTKRHEKICLNSSHICTLLPLRNGGTLIQLYDGFECEVAEVYDDIVNILKQSNQPILDNKS
jgi:hypothetical protein